MTTPFPDPDPNELDHIRQRFFDAQYSVPDFANWIANYALDDMRGLLGMVDGLHLGFTILLDQTLDELFDEDKPDE